MVVLKFGSMLFNSNKMYSTIRLNVDLMQDIEIGEVFQIVDSKGKERLNGVVHGYSVSSLSDVPDEWLRMEHDVHVHSRRSLEKVFREYFKNKDRDWNPTVICILFKINEDYNVSESN